jgi:uncharacterized protein with HEPN domain
MSGNDNIAQQPRVEDITNKPAQTVQAPQTEQTSAQAPVQEFFNLGEAIRAVVKQYEREFPKLTFNTPAQITDGCVVEFIDASMNVTVATARVRVRNRLIVNNENGDMFLQVHLSDLAFSRSSMQVSSK